MRGFLVPLTLLAMVLAGCSSPAADDAGPGEFDGLDVQSSSTTGVIVGVVVDQAIRPVTDVTVTIGKPDGTEASDKTDDLGRFAFGNLVPGTYVVSTRHPQFTSAQSTVEVEAGIEDPPAVRMLIERLFSQDPYSELIKFDGYLACSISFPVGTTCVNDYTRIVGGTVPGCEGGCLRDYNVSKQGGNIREYQSTVGPGWQQIVFEATWEPSMGGTTPEMTISVSYFTRPNTAHFFAGDSQPNPLRLQVDLGDPEPEGQNADEEAGEPAVIGPEGRPDVFVFFNNGGGAGSVTVNQPFRAFQTNFYYGLPPEGWSFVNGDQLPF